LLRAELLDAYRRNGKNFDTGRLIGRMLRTAGLSGFKVKATARVTSPGDYYQTFLLTLTALVRDQIVAGGRLTAAEFDAQAASLREHLEQPGTLTCQPHDVASLGHQALTGLRWSVRRLLAIAMPIKPPKRCGSTSFRTGST